MSKNGLRFVFFKSLNIKCISYKGVRYYNVNPVALAIHIFIKLKNIVAFNH